MNTSTPPTTAPDPSRCPLCGQPNACAMAGPCDANATAIQVTCWCTQVRFSPELLARIPVAARGKACVCAACATAETAAGGAAPSPAP